MHWKRYRANAHMSVRLCLLSVSVILEGKLRPAIPSWLKMLDQDTFPMVYHQWGARRFWLSPMLQFIPGKECLSQQLANRNSCQRIISEHLTFPDHSSESVLCSGLLLINRPPGQTDGAESGVGDLEVAVTAGSQKVLKGSFAYVWSSKSRNTVYDGCRHLKEAGFKGRVIPEFISLNSPG